MDSFFIKFGLGILLLSFGFGSDFHPWDYVACGAGGFLIGSALGSAITR